MQQIDYNAIARNAEGIKRVTSVPLIAVVKSNAYGHGLVQTARCLASIVDCFAVGNVEEAKKIHRFGVPVMLLLPCVSARELAVAAKYGFVVTLSDFASLRLAEQSGLKLTAQIKVDSGMSRLGFALGQLPQALQRLEQSKNIDVAGIYSHFRGTSVSECDEQNAIFVKCAALAEEVLGKTLTKHIASTYASLHYPAYRHDAVRVGLGLYGYGADNLLPAKKVTAKVVGTRTVQKGHVAGYGGVFRAERNTCLAVIDIGYAHGFGRALVGSDVLVDGRKAKAVAVCMGMTICDTGDSLATIGSEAVLLGGGVNPSNCNAIVYELLCNLR